MAITLLTEHPWVSPVELFTLSALFTSEAWKAVAMACEHVTVSSQGVLRMTATRLTASVQTVVPVVRSTLVTVMANDVLPARTSPGLPVTVTLSVTTSRMDGTSTHTGTTSAILGQCISIVTMLTVGAGRAVSVVQALQALTSPGITGLGILGVNVPIALAWEALPSRLLWVAIVARGTLVAAWSCVALFAVADDLVR